jgi:hypothetical protein
MPPAMNASFRLRSRGKVKSPASCEAMILAPGRSCARARLNALPEAENFTPRRMSGADGAEAMVK